METGIVARLRDQLEREVAERRRAEEALRASEDRFSALIENASDAILIVDGGGNILYASPSILRVFGYRLPEIVNRGIHEFLHPEDIDSITETFTALVADPGARVTAETRVRHRDGSWRVAEGVATNLLDDSQVRGIVINYSDVTRRKQADQALLDSERRYRLLAENVTDVIFTTDMNMRPTYLSPSITRLLGYDVEEAAMRTAEEMLSPDSLKLALQAVVNGQAGDSSEGSHRGPATVELCLHHRNGSEVWAEVTVSILHDLNGRPVEILGVARDITKRRKAELALRESEENFRALAENAIDGILIAMDDGAYVYANKRAAEITGYSVPELRRATIEDLAHPDQLQWIKERYRRRLEGKRVARRYETALMRKDGRSVPVEVADAKTVWQGRMASMVIVRDIAERKRAEDEMRVKNSAIASSMNAIVITDLEGGILYVNPAFLRLWKFESEDEVIGRSAGSFTNVADKVDEAIAILNQERHWQGEFSGLRTKDGSRYAVHVSASVVTDDSGSPIRLMTCFVDITERKQMEDKLQQLYEQERQLRQELEAEINKRVDFTRALVHELKTPLTSVMASSELLVSELPEGTLLSMARNLERGACSLNRRIDELLDLARGELGMLHLNCKPIDVSRLVQDVGDEMASAAARYGQWLMLDVPDALPLLWGDEERLQQVILNLLNNAFKFSQPGGEVTLRARQTDDAVLVQVQDRGGGISEEEQERLFKPYHRLEKDRERLSGLGLGLSLCKTLVELHGGTIWLNSIKGEGSTFSFLIPLAANHHTDTTILQEVCHEGSDDRG